MATLQQGPSGSTDGATFVSMAKISISLDDDLYQRLRTAVGEKGVSAWIAETAAARLRKEILREVANEIALETGGPFTQEEKEEARRWLFSSSTPAPSSSLKRLSAIPRPPEQRKHLVV
jgi:predicted transcriptional regulator